MHNGSEHSRPHADVRPVGSNPHADDAMKMQPNRSQSRVSGVLMTISV